MNMQWNLCLDTTAPGKGSNQDSFRLTLTGNDIGEVQVKPGSMAFDLSISDTPVVVAFVLYWKFTSHSTILSHYHYVGSGGF